MNQHSSSILPAHKQTIKIAHPRFLGIIYIQKKLHRISQFTCNITIWVNYETIQATDEDSRDWSSVAFERWRYKLNCTIKKREKRQNCTSGPYSVHLMGPGIYLVTYLENFLFGKDCPAIATADKAKNTVKLSNRILFIGLFSTCIVSCWAYSPPRWLCCIPTPGKLGFNEFVCTVLEHLLAKNLSLQLVIYLVWALRWPSAGVPSWAVPPVQHHDYKSR